MVLDPQFQGVKHTPTSSSPRQPNTRPTLSHINNSTNDTEPLGQDSPQTFFTDLLNNSSPPILHATSMEYSPLQPPLTHLLPLLFLLQPVIHH